VQRPVLCEGRIYEQNFGELSLTEKQDKKKEMIKILVTCAHPSPIHIVLYVWLCAIIKSRDTNSIKVFSNSLVSKRMPLENYLILHLTQGKIEITFPFLSVFSGQ
jgi:hypothetical protein